MTMRFAIVLTLLIAPSVFAQAQPDSAEPEVQKALARFVKRLTTSIGKHSASRSMTMPQFFIRVPSLSVQTDEPNLRRHLKRCSSKFVAAKA